MNDVVGRYDLLLADRPDRYEPRRKTGRGASQIASLRGGCLDGGSISWSVPVPRLALGGSTVLDDAAALNAPRSTGSIRRRAGFQTQDAFLLDNL